MLVHELSAALADVADDRLRDRLAAYGAALAAHNERLNLTSARDAAALAEHLRDALTLVPYVVDPYVDVGSGGGLPAFPLALATGVATTCIESVAKKARALRAIAAGLLRPDEPPTIEIACGRAETFARDERYREHFASATARAVGSAPTVIELLVPLLRVGGLAILQRGALADRERHAAADAALVLGAEVVDEIALGGERRLLLVRKRRPTGHRFPRKAGVPEKRPLCFAGSGAS